MLDTTENKEQPSMEERLQELAANGIGCKAGSEQKRKRPAINDQTAQVGNIIYRFYSDAHSLLSALRTNHPKYGIDVLAFGHNCIQRHENIMKFLAPRIKGLVEADKATGRSPSKLGTFCGVRFPGNDGKEAFVTSLYVQYSTGIPKKAKPNYKPSYKGKYHVVPKHVLSSVLSLSKTFRDRKIGIVMFGTDRHFPMPWELIEQAIDEVCSREGRTITLFVPMYMLTQSKQELSPNLKEAARSVGYAFV